MTIADLEQRARHKDRDVECAPDDELAIVEIARMSSRRAAVDPPCRRRRRDAHAAEERLERDHDSGLELGRLCFRVDLQNFLWNCSIAILGNKAAAPVIAVVDRKIDREDLDLERISGLSAF